MREGVHFGEGQVQSMRQEHSLCFLKGMAQGTLLIMKCISPTSVSFENFPLDEAMQENAPLLPFQQPGLGVKGTGEPFLARLSSLM